MAAGTVKTLKYVVKKGIIAVPQLSEYVTVKVLVSTAAETVVAPADAQVITMTGNLDFYVNFLVTTTAGLPGADNTTGQSPIFVAAGVPLTKGLSNKTTFSMIAPAATVVTMEWFK